MENMQQIFIDAYQTHSDAIFRLCFFKLSDREQAKDMMQETFTKAFIMASKEKAPILNIKAFLYKIAGNMIIDEYRKRGRHQQSTSLDVLQEEGFDPSEDKTDSLISILDGKEAIDLISKIKEPYGEAVFMRYVQDLSLKEISEITGESENTISVRVHRGITILRTLYRHE